MRSNRGLIASGKYQKQNFNEAVDEMYSNDMDYVRYLYHYGVLQKGHEKCDPAFCDAIANYETEHPEHIPASGRIFPPADFWFTFGTQKGSTLQEADRPYVITIMKNASVTAAHPWLVEAFELQESQRKKVRQTQTQDQGDEELVLPRRYRQFKHQRSFPGHGRHANAGQSANQDIATPGVATPNRSSPGKGIFASIHAKSSQPSATASQETRSTLPGSPNT
jgi:hypothetical protein